MNTALQGLERGSEESFCSRRGIGGQGKVFVFGFGSMSASHMLMRMLHCGGRSLQWEKERWLEQCPTVDKRWQGLHAWRGVSFSQGLGQDNLKQKDESTCMWTGGAGGGSLGHSLSVVFLDVINATSFHQGSGREKAMGF